jgi:hypothetical protein
VYSSLQEYTVHNIPKKFYYITPMIHLRAQG